MTNRMVLAVQLHHATGLIVLSCSSTFHRKAIPKARKALLPKITLDNVFDVKSSQAWLEGREPVGSAPRAPEVHRSITRYTRLFSDG